MWDLGLACSRSRKKAGSEAETWEVRSGRSAGHRAGRGIGHTRSLFSALTVVGNHRWEAHSGAYVEKRCRAAKMTTLAS